MKYFNLSEADSWKIHILFSPRVVPIWLTRKHIYFCLDLHDKIYPEKGSGSARLIELWFALKTIDPLEDEQLLNSLSRIFQDKMSIAQEHRKTMAFGLVKYFIEKEPVWKRDSCWKKILGKPIYKILSFGETIDGMPDWQQMEYWQRFLDEEK